MIVEPTYLRSRKESIVAGLIWFGSGLWVLLTCYFIGYGKPVRPIGGIPHWALWGVFVPWVVLLAANTWYSLVYLRDDDLRDGDTEPGDDRSNDPPVGSSNDPSTGPSNDEGER